MHIYQNIQIKKITALVLLGLMVLIYGGKTFHTHHYIKNKNGAASKIMASSKNTDFYYLIEKPPIKHCSICDFVFSKDAERGSCLFSFLHPDYNIPVNEQLSVTVVQLVKCPTFFRGPPTA